MTPETKSWLDFAQQDFLVAQHLYDVLYPKPLEIICYHCQQAAEKAIKAVMVSLGCPGGLPKRHDLSFLLDQLHKTVSVSGELYDAADALTPYGVAARYTNEMFLEEHHASQALRDAARILDWAKQILL